MSKEIDVPLDGWSRPIPQVLQNVSRIDAEDLGIAYPYSSQGWFYTTSEGGVVIDYDMNSPRVVIEPSGPIFNKLSFSDDERVAISLSAMRDTISPYRAPESVPLTGYKTHPLDIVFHNWNGTQISLHQLICESRFRHLVDRLPDVYVYYGRGTRQNIQHAHYNISQNHILTPEPTGLRNLIVLLHEVGEHIKETYEIIPFNDPQRRWNQKSFPKAKSRKSKILSINPTFPAPSIQSIPEDQWAKAMKLNSEFEAWEISWTLLNILREKRYLPFKNEDILNEADIHVQTHLNSMIVKYEGTPEILEPLFVEYL